MDYLNDEINFGMEEYEESLKHAVDFALSEFNNVRTGRVSPSILERITVEYYGTPTHLRELASITNEDSRTLIINPWDIAVRPEVCKALGAANVGANPIDNGQYIRMIFPALTEDRRKELVRQAKGLAENARVVMRNERRDCLDKIRKTAKADKMSEDDIKQIESDIQKILDTYNANLDTFLSRKEAEIMTI
jgi:ribosome recycling factor